MTPQTLYDARRAAQDCLTVYPEYTPATLPRDTVIIENKNARVMVQTDAYSQTITFCGSNDCRDWMMNFRPWRVKRSHVGSVFDGVADYHDLIRDPLIAALDPKKRKIYQGHSLGGAVAKRAAAGHASKGGVVEAVFTFGAPMVGGKDFNDVYASLGLDSHDFWAPGDVVPYMPRLLGLPIGYTRQSGLHVLSQGTLTDKIPSWLASKPWKTWREEHRVCHSMLNYIPLMAGVRP